MSYFLQAIQELRSVSVSDYEELVEDICRELDMETIEKGGWPPSFFTEMLNLLSDPKFLSVRTSWNVLLFIKKNWNRLSPSESSALRNVLYAAFDKFGDFTGPQLVCKILGEFYTDDKTLSMLKSLSITASSPARELIPHGFEILARSTKDEELRGLAIYELQKLRESESEHVRCEAEISLTKLGQKTG